MLKPDGIYCDCCDTKFAELPTTKEELLAMIEEGSVGLDEGETLDMAFAQIEAVRSVH